MTAGTASMLIFTTAGCFGRYWKKCGAFCKEREATAGYKASLSFLPRRPSVPPTLQTDDDGGPNPPIRPAGYHSLRTALGAEMRQLPHGMLGTAASQDAEVARRGPCRRHRE